MSAMEIGADRRGTALLVTVSALSLLAILATASLAVVQGRLRGARRLRAVHESALATTRALDSTLAAWPAEERERMRDGDTITLVDVPGRDHLTVTRLGASLFRLDAAAIRGDLLAAARHAASLLVFVRRPRLDHHAPLVVAAGATIGADVRLVGAPAGGCADPAIPIVDLIAVDTGRVRWEGSRGSTREDPAAGASVVDTAAIARVADAVLPTGSRWTPVPDSTRTVLARGDLTLGPGQGRGLVVALGTVSLEGPLQFHGSIIALGGLSSTADDISISGTVVSIGDLTIRGHATLTADPCAVAVALSRASHAEPLSHWSESPIR